MKGLLSLSRQGLSLRGCLLFEISSNHRNDKHVHFEATALTALWRTTAPMVALGSFANLQVADSQPAYQLSAPHTPTLRQFYGLSRHSIPTNRALHILCIPKRNP